MVKSTGYYRLGLYLTSAIALSEFVLFLYLVSFSFEAANRATIRVIAALAIVFGLWVLSNVARYVGAIWFLISVGSVIWPLVASDKIVFGAGLIWALVVGALSLTASWLLLLSKQFGNEFAYQRETQPKYKRTLRAVAIVVVVVLAIVATANDIYHLLIL
jgi:hypothetical protein